MHSKGTYDLSILYQPLSSAVASSDRDHYSRHSVTMIPCQGNQSAVASSGRDHHFVTTGLQQRRIQQTSEE